jgi:hypothetical protein
MRDTKGAPRISDADRFGELNFHSSQLREELTDWLAEFAGILNLEKGPATGAALPITIVLQVA